jgi:hypothetical protein
VIWKALMLQQWTGKNIRVMCDNTTTIAYVNKFEGTRSQALLHLSRRIWNFCLQTDTRLHLQYVASAFNPADASFRRMESQLEWRIATKYFVHLNRKWGPYTVDMFAHRTNHHLPLCDLEVRLDSPSDGCHVDGLAANGPTIFLPSMESVTTSDCQDSERTRYRNTDSPVVDISYLVPSSETNGSTRPLKVPRTMVLPPLGHHQNVLQENPHWLLAAWIFVACQRKLTRIYFLGFGHLRKQF